MPNFKAAEKREGNDGNLTAPAATHFSFQQALCAPIVGCITYKDQSNFSVVISFKHSIQSSYRCNDF